MNTYIQNVPYYFIQRYVMKMANLTDPFPCLYLSF